ncbi:MAG TPA: protein-L-isoaspartate(D-aspartate) O-methyltransferase [Thermoanaerobaculia bacterium]|nr:protein-L-isoaspartate(D-aspartate) O-methyltransferase [Thermoanaerobaculia bacterium]
MKRSHDMAMTADLAALRDEMIARQLAARGVRDERVLEAMRAVPREEFVPPELVEFAYEDSPLPISEQQTISQPYIVALMAEALELQPGDRVLEVGTGSGYAAAVLAHLAAEVHTIERHESLAVSARRKLVQLGYANVQVIHGDGSLGWTQSAPYDAIVAAAGGPDVPPALLEQLAPGGRLVMPVGSTPREQTLVRLRKRPDGRVAREDLGPVRFVPLIGAAGWPDAGAGVASGPAAVTRRKPQLATLLAEAGEPLPNVAEADLGALLERIGEARVVLLGEATHGTSEFYALRARITQELVARHGFRIVAAEADWPDAARVDRWLRGRQEPAGRPVAFTRFPTWMWRNREMLSLFEWLRRFDHGRPPEDQAGFYGLDLYSLFHSIGAVVHYLHEVDPETARVARQRYGCLSPWEGDPAAYGRAALTARYGDCEGEVVAMLRELLDKRLELSANDGDRFFDAVQNARLIADAERYYKVMYYGGRESWNLRDQHMFDTLLALLEFRGADSKAVVWAHNSHVGDAAATEMGSRGEHNVGHLCRRHFGSASFNIGFGTDHGTVMAADNWDEPGKVMKVRPARADSYEGAAHQSAVPAFFLSLREPRGERGAEARDALLQPRLERAIGVIYRPQTEVQSHYFEAYLPAQFDEWVWIDETRAVTPLPGPSEPGGVEAETFPFGV